MDNMKLRVYDMHEDRMIYSCDFYSMEFKDDGTIWRISVRDSPDIYHINPCCIFIMYSTLRSDLNDKEIYEKDVVIIPNYTGLKQYIVEYIDGIWELTPLDGIGEGDFLTNYAADEVEIVDSRWDLP